MAGKSTDKLRSPKSKTRERSPAADAAYLFGKEFGWVTIPLKVIGTGKGKRVLPLVKYAHLNGQPFDIDLFKELWQDHLDAPGLGILSPDVVEIEADTEKGNRRLRGLRLPRTPTFRSTRGLKYLFAAPEREFATGPNLLGDGIEVLHNKLLIIPPTPNYRWLKDRSPAKVQLAPIPDRVLAKLKPTRKVRKSQKGSRSSRIGEGQRHHALLSLAGAMRAKGAGVSAILAALRKVNEKQCDPPLPDAEVKALAQDVASRYPADSDEHQTDTGNARQLVSMYQDEILYCPDHKAWYIWNGKFWERDTTLKIERLAKLTVHQMQEVALQIEDSKERGHVLSHWMRTESQAKLRAMIENARSEVAIAAKELAPDPYLLCVENGTINLKTGKLQPHNPKDLITLMAQVEFDPEATDARWEEVLDRFVRPDEGKEEFLQRAAFASFTGTSEKAFINLFDELVGDTGKTTFVESLLGVLGPYGATVNSESFLVNRQGIRADLASCYWKRLVVSSEIPAGRRLDVELMKKLTAGSGEFQYERKYENPWQGPITFTIWLDGNSLPKARVEDNPLFDRWRMAAFRHKIPKRDRDTKWLEKNLDAEYKAAVLAWVMRGRRAWLKGGIGTESVIQEATDRARKAMDPLAEFWAEHVRFGEDYWVASADLFERLGDWYGRNRMKPMGQENVFALLRMRGAERKSKKISGRAVRGWRGLKLRRRT